MGASRAIAWVESPLQLLAAAEFAESSDQPIDVAMRVSGPQMPETAHSLLERGARFATCVPYLGIPWSMLASRRHWVVGDGFSGQFHLALSVLGTMGSRRLTLLDDGIMTVRLARGLAGSGAFGRPGGQASSRRELLGSLTRERMLSLAAREELEFFSVFAEHEALRALSARGVPAIENTFAWLRNNGRPIALPGRTVVLGAAAVADRSLSEDQYLEWVTTVAQYADGPAAYLPHRREPARILDRVAQVPGLTVVHTGIPVELALAGLDTDIEVVTLPSTAAVTLRIVLAGSGSVVHTHRIPEVVR